MNILFKNKEKSDATPVWNINNNCIINGDCLEVMKSIPNKSIDAIITDPPYG